jgi:hypothetical protein
MTFSQEGKMASEFNGSATVPELIEQLETWVSRIRVQWDERQWELLDVATKQSASLSARLAQRTKVLRELGVEGLIGPADKEPHS